MRKRRNIAFTISVATFLGVCVVSVSAKDLPCGDLRTAKASRLISTSQLYRHGTEPARKVQRRECGFLRRGYISIQLIADHEPRS